MSNRNARFDNRARGRYLRSLAELEDAGLPHQRAAATLHDSAPARDRSALAAFRRQTNAGVPLAEAGRRSGLWGEWEASALRVAAASGRLSDALKALATHYETRARQERAVKGRLLLPGVVLLLGSLLAPLPGAVLGRYAAAEYLVRALIPVAVLGSVALGIVHVAFRPPGTGGDGSGGVVLHVPVLGRLVRKRARRDHLRALSLLVGAGMPILEALELAAGTVSNRALRERFQRASAEARSGSTVADALLAAGVIDPAVGHALISTGEQSGKLDESIRRYADRVGDEIRGAEALLAEWLPRVAYVAVLALVAWNVWGAWVDRLAPG